MSFTALVIAVLLTGALIIFVFLPLFERQPDQKPRRKGPAGTTRQNLALETLWDEHQRVLRAIRDLDFDYDMDKLTDDTYQTQRVYLVRVGVAIMRRIDELEAEMNQQQARVDAAVAALRQSREE